MEKVYVNPDHASQLFVQMSKLWKRDKYCDAALNLGSTRYKLHKLILVAACPDIMRLLLHTEENNVFDFYIPSGHDRSAVESVLKYLYEGIIQLNQANVNGIDKFAQNLQFQSLIKYCIHYKTLLINGYCCQPDNREKVFCAPESVPISDDNPAQDCAYNINMISSGNLIVPRLSIQETVETRNPFSVLGAPALDIVQDETNCKTSSLLDTVPISVKSEPDTSDVEISEDTQTDLIMSVTDGENDNLSNGTADSEQMPSSNNGQLTLNTDITQEDFIPYSSLNLISTQGEFITYSSTDLIINQDEITPCSSFQQKPAQEASVFMEVLPVNSVLKHYSDTNSESVTVLTYNDSVQDTVSKQMSQNSEQSTSSLDKTAVYFPEIVSEKIASCEEEEQTGSASFTMVCESMSTAAKDKVKMPESNIPDNQHADFLLEAPPPYQSSGLHHGMHVGSRTDNIPYTENCTGSDSFIQNNTKKPSMSAHYVQCSLDDSEEDMDMEAESDLEENSADSKKINRCIPQYSPHLVLPNIGTSLKVLKQFLKGNKLPSDIEIDTINEESVEDFMILEEIKGSPYQPSSTTKVVSGQPYVYKTVGGIVTQAGIHSQVLPDSQVNKLPRSPRQPESEKKKVVEPKRPLGGPNKDMSGQPVTSGKPDTLGQRDKVGQAAQLRQPNRLRKLNNGWVRKKLLRSAEKVMPSDVYQAKLGIKKKKYKCAECNKLFDSQTSLCSHKIIHQQRHFKCKICKGTFHKIYLFTAHLKMHRSRGYFITFGKENKFKCSICGSLFETVKGLEEHLTLHRQNDELIPKKKNVKFECEICGKDIENWFNYEAHMDKHKKMKKVSKDVHIFECQICGRDILNSHNYELHLYKHQKDKDI